MSMIYLFQIEEMIVKIEKSGDKVKSSTHAIYASKNVRFDEDVYPLEIIVSDQMPSAAVCIIARKEKR